MNIRNWFVVALSICFLNANAQEENKKGDWTNYVRIGGHGLSKGNIDATIKDAEDTYLFGIEVDNDIPGRYNSFLDPQEKLDDLKALANRAHAINNRAFVYIAGLECITPGADTAAHTFFKDHPDWVQRDINNRPAKFGGGEAFWISGGDEDVWISPYATEWRKLFMKQVRQIAETGIDGIYVDIPYWMTHFKGWENTWASFDQYTVDAFRKKTGLDARKDLKLGDMKNANFRKWIDFRIQTLTDFMAEISANAKSVNPDCKVIAEIYPGIGDEAVRVGADVYQMYDAIDAIAHEYSGGGGNAASKNPDEWFSRMVGMYTFRAFAGEKASWMLSYSWMKKDKLPPAEPMKNLALSNIMAGTNNYDAKEYVMSGTNDIDTRKLMFKWVAEHENLFYSPRKPMAPVGIYFSPATRNYNAASFTKSFEGMMEMMLQGHVEFQIVTPRTLKEFGGTALILPDVKCISADEVEMIKDYAKGDRRLVVTGETGKYDEHGEENESNAIYSLLKVSKTSAKTLSARGGKNFSYYPQCPGKSYAAMMKTDFNKAAWSNQYSTSTFYTFLNKFKKEVASVATVKPLVSIEANPFVATQLAMVEGKPTIYIANFAGLKNNKVAKQTPAKNVKVSFRGPQDGKIYYLPYLGEKQLIRASFNNGRLTAAIPAIDKGGVVWMEN